jgi:ABC-2 type transport system ATP-binding protein
VKSYGGVRAVAGLALRVPLGGVHGLLGPNGSGKTTTIRMALGLAYPDGGQLRVLGESVRPGHADVVRRVGAIVEQPKFFPAFSGRRSLSLLARSIGVPPARVDEVVAQVGLQGWDRSKVASYSFGMKQRLALAAALLKRPELVILDEPTNGLDPAGIQQVRVLVRSLAQQGCTVLLSSHVLAEVEQMVDTVSIIGQGRLIAEGRLSDLLARTENCVVVTLPGAPVAAAVLQGLYQQDGAPVPPWSIVVTSAETFEVRGAPGAAVPDPALINRTLAAHGWYARELRIRTEPLEQVFLRLTTPVPAHAGAEGAA